MSALRALQGLFAGVNQGLGGFLDNREQQAEIMNREKLTAVAEAQAQREQQAQEFNQAKAAYEAMMNPVDATDPIVSMATKYNLPLHKQADGKVMRPLQAPEQAQLGAINPTLQGQIAAAEHAPVAATTISEGALNRGSQMEQLRAQLANSQAIAQGNNATTIAAAGMNNDARVHAAEAAAQAAQNRLMSGITGKEINEPEYMVWKQRYLKDPVNQKFYADALARGKSEMELDLVMRKKIYPQFRNAGLF
jgi:hypothetical protein